MNISKRIIEALGGQIDYFKNAGPGTTFYIDMPLGNGSGRELAHGIHVKDMVNGDGPIGDEEPQKPSGDRAAA